MTRRERMKYKNLKTRFRELQEAIKLRCYDCLACQILTDCGHPDCPLYPFRLKSKFNSKILASKMKCLRQERASFKEGDNGD